MFPMIMGVFSAFLIVFLLSGAFIFQNVFNSSSQVGYETITVDSFVNSDYSDELKEWFEKSEYYTVANVEYKYSATVPQGTIIEQSPSEGVRKKVQRGKKPCKIKLVVSGGEQKLTLGNFSVRDYRLAVSELRSMGLVCSVEKVYDDSIEIGYVVTTEPESGTIVESGDKITLLVSKGPEEGDIEVPDFVGKTEAEVLVLLAKLNLSPGNVIYERSDKKAGTITSQSILPEAKVSARTPIDFSVSGGPKYGKGAADDSGDSDNKGSKSDTDTPITLDPISKITDSSKVEDTAPEKESSESESEESDSESESKIESESEESGSESDGEESAPERDDG